MLIISDIIMNIKYYIISLLLTAAILNSCEETMSDTELPYLEKMVVMCVLEAGKPLVKFEITKTLPPLYSDGLWGGGNDFIISGVTGSISDGSNVYSITKIGNMVYEAEGLIPEAGKTYTLSLKWKDKSVWAATTIPYPVSIDSTGTRKDVSEWNQYDSLTFIVAYFKPNNSSVYFGYFLDGSKLYGDAVKRYDRVSGSDYCSLVVSPGWFNVIPEKYTVYVESWDLPFYDYWTTRNNGDSDNEIFSTSGVNIKWNIQGDGLGLFIGTSESEGYEVK